MMYYRGQTALHKAAWYQRRTICCMLVEAKASLTMKDYHGNTPRMQALKADDKELAAYLESKDTKSDLRVSMVETYSLALYQTTK